MKNDKEEHHPPGVMYEGPDFEEFCIAEGRYLAARRDRRACLSCPLRNLCEAGFDEQARRVRSGKNPSLTDGCAFDPGLPAQLLLEGLSEEQVLFVRQHIRLTESEE